MMPDGEVSALTEYQWDTVEDFAAELQLRPPFSAEQMCAAITEHWGTPIEIRPYTRETCPLPTFTTGACRFEGAVFVLYCYVGGSRSQQERIKFHELGHLVFEHVSPDRPGFLPRGHVLSPKERLAESFAREMSLYAMYGASAPDPQRSTDDDPPDDPVLQWHRSLDR